MHYALTTARKPAKLSLSELDELYRTGRDVIGTVERLAGYEIVEEENSVSTEDETVAPQGKPEAADNKSDALSFDPSAFFASFREIHTGGPTFADIIGESDR